VAEGGVGRDEKPGLFVPDRVGDAADTSAHDGGAAGVGLQVHEPEALHVLRGLASGHQENVGLAVVVAQLLLRNAAQEVNVPLEPELADQLPEKRAFGALPGDKEEHVGDFVPNSVESPDGGVESLLGHEAACGQNKGAVHGPQLLAEDWGRVGVENVRIGGIGDDLDGPVRGPELPGAPPEKAADGEHVVGPADGRPPERVVAPLEGREAEGIEHRVLAVEGDGHAAGRSRQASSQQRGEGGLPLHVEGYVERFVPGPAHDEGERLQNEEVWADGKPLHRHVEGGVDGLVARSGGG
jgi:hypothetical protein